MPAVSTYPIRRLTSALGIDASGNVGRQTAAEMVDPSVTPGASPATGQMWLSSSLARLSVDPSPARRYHIGLVGQEISAWYDNSRYNLIYTNGAGHLAYTYCLTDPLVAANWAAAVEVVGGGVGGLAGQAAHSFVYIESTTLYCFFVEISTQNVRVATAALAAPTVWTTQAGTIIGPQGTGINGNICVVKDGSTYRMFLECLHQDDLPIEGTTNSWQIVTASCATVTGTYVVQINPVTTLRPNAHGAVCGPQLFKEGSTWICYYHGYSWARVYPNDIYRATCTNLTTDSWTLDNAGYPFMRRAHRYDVDQAVDPCVCVGPNNLTYLFYTGADNRHSQFKLMVTMLLPAWYQYDGAAWRPVQSGADPSPPNSENYQLVQFSPVAGPGSTSNTVGTWTLDASTAPPRLYNSSAAQNDLIEYDLTLSPGNYQIDVWYQKGSNKAIIDLGYEDGAGSYYVTLPSIDGYASGTSQYNKATRLLRIFGTETYRRRVRFKATTKNASSSNYEIALQGVQVRDDGFYPDLVVNGQFYEGVTSWGTPGSTVTWSAASNQLTIVRSGSLDAAPNQTITGLTIGKAYLLTCNVASADVNANWGGNNTLTVGNGRTVNWTADATSKLLQFWPVANSTVILSKVSIREVAS